MPYVLLLRVKVDVTEGSSGGVEALSQRGSCFRGHDHFSLIIEDKVKGPKIDGRSRGQDSIVVGHPKHGERDVENAQGPYQVRQLSVF